MLPNLRDQNWLNMKIGKAYEKKNRLTNFRDVPLF